MSDARKIASQNQQIRALQAELRAMRQSKASSWVQAAGGLQLRFYRLVEDAEDNVLVDARRCTRDGTFTEVDPIEIVNWKDMITDALEDYIALCGLVDDEWVVVTGDCIVPP